MVLFTAKLTDGRVRILLELNLTDEMVRFTTNFTDGRVRILLKLNLTDRMVRFINGNLTRGLNGRYINII